MKIAFVYDAVYPFVKGGVEKRVWEIAVRLAGNGHEVHIYGMKFWDGDPTLIRDGVTVHGVCPARSFYVNGRRSFYQALVFSLGLFAPLARERFDLIDCQQFPYLPCFLVFPVSFIKRTPVVVTWHEVWGDYWYTYLGRAGFFGKLIERLVMAGTTDAVSVSLTTSRQLKRSGYSGPVTVIPNGVDLQRVQKVTPSGDPVDLIFAGRLIQDKHADVLIHAFSRIVSEQPERKLLIIGEGPEKGTLEALACDLCPEGSVRFIGFLDNYDEVLARIKSSEICVLPSTREGFGIIALEALACGIPVVTVDHPSNATRDLITEKNGFLSRLTVTDLADTIRTALHHARGMGDACRTSAGAYDWDRIASDAGTYYRTVIERHRHS